MFDASINAISVYRENPAQYSNVFQVDDTERPIAANMFDFMNNLPVKYANKNMAIITADDSWGMESATGMRERAEQQGGRLSLRKPYPTAPGSGVQF